MWVKMCTFNPIIPVHFYFDSRMESGLRWGGVGSRIRLNYTHSPTHPNTLTHTYTHTLRTSRDSELVLCPHSPHRKSRSEGPSSHPALCSLKAHEPVDLFSSVISEGSKCQSGSSVLLPRNQQIPFLLRVTQRAFE